MENPPGPDVLATDAPKPDGAYRPSAHRLGFTLGALATIGPLAIDLYLPSFPAIAHDLDVSPAAVQATMAIYFFGMAIGQLFYGPLSDRFGRKLPLNVGLILFVSGSLGCALSTSIDMLMACRLLQALGAASQQVMTMAMARDHFRGRDLIRVSSALLTVSGIAPIVAPVLGGQLVTYLGWRAVFWTLTGAGCFCLIWSNRMLPESLPKEARHPHSPVSVARVYFQLLRDRRFIPHAAAGCLLGAGFSTYLAGAPFVFMGLFGLRPNQFGWLFAINSAGLIGAAQISGRISTYFRPVAIINLFMIMTAVASIVLYGVTMLHWGGLPGMFIVLFVYLSSRGFVIPPNNALAMEHQGRNAGSAAALMGVLRLISGGGMNTLLTLLYDGTAAPFAILLALAGLGACAIHLAWGRDHAEE